MNLDELKQLDPSFLQRAKRTGYICPACNNGSGADGDGITKDKRTGRWHCFKCGFHGTNIDLIGVYFGITDNAAMIAKAYEYYGVDRPQKGRDNKNPQKSTNYTRTQEKQATQETHNTQEKHETQEDFSTFIEQAEKLNDYQYLQGRGITPETQARFHVGFVPDWKSPQAVKTTIEKGGNPANLPTSPRCIIPRSRYNYLARDVRPEDQITPEQRKYVKQNTGKTSLFNAEALQADVVFIVEGEIDAMSIEQSGGNACGLCSVSNRGILLNYLKENRKPGQAFILMLDNDEAGKAGTAELEKGLQEMGLVCLIADYSEHDPNDFLQHDAPGLESLISFLQVKAAEAVADQRGNEYNAADLLDYFKTIEQHPAGFEVKTGFPDLDRELSGGLHEGLYIIGAISSLGKTTFTLQLADQIAEQGQDVIFFSLEMSKYELIAKSLSRHTYDIARDAKTKGGERWIARDTQQILNNRRYSAYSPEEKQVIAQAIAAYEPQAQNLYIYEGRYKGQRLTVGLMREIVKAHIEQTRKKPVVFVDYLQIIAPADTHATDKQNTDIAVFELKEISRDYSIPVFAISSFNRENYNEPVSMQSFKESGAVEYSSDVLFGLQYAGMEYIEGDTDKKRKERLRELTATIYRNKRERKPIEIELKCLKSRNGYQFSMGFYMQPAYNHFEQILNRGEFESYMNDKKQGKRVI